MYRKILRTLAVLMALSIFLPACAPGTAMTGMSSSTVTQTAAAPDAELDLASFSASQPGVGEPNVHFTLKTGIVDGKMAFSGVGGEIDGIANPDLNVQPGDVVEITLQDGDGVTHDIVLPDFKIASAKVTKSAPETKVIFKVGNAGSYVYYCSLPGHRAAGMQGRLISGKPAPIVEKQYPSVSRAPDDLPGPLKRSTPERIVVNLETSEVEGRLADGTGYTFWTFNGKVPGPFIRVRVGDTVEVHLKNSTSSSMAHSVDFHAVTGPGGGAVATQTKPGEETMFTFQALNQGLFVYHCATPMVAHHISNGMYGLILVEPEGGLPPVDREFYVMQGEVYTEQALGMKGDDTFSEEKLMDERPEYYVFNGSVGALTTLNPLKAKVGETVRIFFGVGGPNHISSFHVIGEIFDRVYDQASLTAPPLTDVQTTLVPAGGATVVEFKLQVPGRFILVDHALSRMERGLSGYLIVDGDANPAIFDGKTTAGSGH
jgi:nitrite reductase (NO-forming)